MFHLPKDYPSRHSSLLSRTDLKVFVKISYAGPPWWLSGEESPANAEARVRRLVWEDLRAAKPVHHDP